MKSLRRNVLKKGTNEVGGRRLDNLILLMIFFQYNRDIRIPRHSGLMANCLFPWDILKIFRTGSGFTFFFL